MLIKDRAQSIISCLGLLVLIGLANPVVAAEVHDLTLDQSGTVLIDGRQTIKVRPGTDLDSFIWVALDQPTAPIDSFTAVLHLPRPVDPANPPAFKLLGIKGVGTATSRLVDPTTVRYEATAVQPTATVSVLADFPKGYLTLPASAQAVVAVSRLSSLWIGLSLALPGLGLLILIIMVLERARDHRLSPTVAPRSDRPSPLAPALVSMLYEDKIEPEAIAATIIDLAERGYLSLYVKGPNFIIAKEREIDLNSPSFALGQHAVNLSEAEVAIAQQEGLRPFEKILLSKLFVAARPVSSKEDVKVRVGHGLFSTKVAAIYEYLFADASQANVFVGHAATVHRRYLIGGWLLFALGAIGFGIGALTLPDPKYFLLFWVGLLIVAYVVVRLAPYVPLRSAVGRQTLGEFLAYRATLTKKLPIEPGQGSGVDRFFQELPTAWALRAHHEWAARFTHSVFHRPRWYFTPTELNSSVEFIAELDHLVSFVAEAFSTVREKTLV